MKVKVDWELTVVVFALFLGSFLGSFFYSAYNGLGQRVKTLETTMEIVAESSLVSLQGIMKLEKEGLIPRYDFVDFESSVAFDPNDLMRKYFNKEL